MLATKYFGTVFEILAFFLKNNSKLHFFFNIKYFKNINELLDVITYKFQEILISNLDSKNVKSPVLTKELIKSQFSIHQQKPLPKLFQC